MYYSEDNTPRRSPERTGRPVNSNRTAPPVAGTRSGYSSARPGYPAAPARPRTQGRPEAQRSAPDGRRYSASNRKFRHKRNSSRPVVIALAAVLVAGLGIFGAVKLLPMFNSVPVSAGSSASSSVASDDATAPETSDVTAPAVNPDADAAVPAVKPDFEVKVAACYSDDAFVVEHLQVPTSVSTPVILASTTSDTSASYSTEPVAVGSSGRDNIAQWKATNSDTVAWLRIPGTKIDYPVVQGPSTSYYTEKGYDKKYSKNGVIWAAGDCEFGSGASTDLSANTVLYGHNWTNYSGTPRVLGPNDVMFAQLTSYHYQWFTQSHPYIWFSTENEEMLWQVFAVFYADTGFRYINPAGGQALLDGVLARSEFIIDVPVTTSDKILTLSTCTQRFGPSRQQRFVVCAKLVSGVSEEAPTVTMNPNPVRPRV